MTHVWPFCFPGMYFHMFLQITICKKSYFTSVTFVRFFSSMYFQMFLHSYIVHACLERQKYNLIQPSVDYEKRFSLINTHVSFTNAYMYNTRKWIYLVLLPWRHMWGQRRCVAEQGGREEEIPPTQIL